MADGTLEREALADGTLSAADLAPAVAAVHTELWKWVGRGKARGNTSLGLSKADWVLLGNTQSPGILSCSSRPVISLSFEAESYVVQADLELTM